jgi:hypothetical protein
MIFLEISKIKNYPKNTQKPKIQNFKNTCKEASNKKVQK